MTISKFSLSLLFTALANVQNLSAISPDKMARIEQEVSKRMAEPYSQIETGIKWIDKVRLGLETLAKKRNEEWAKIQQAEGKFREALDIKYPTTDYEKQVKKMTPHQIERQLEDFENEKTRVKRHYDRGELSTSYESFSRELNKLIFLREKFLQLADSEMNQFPEALDLRSSYERAVFTGAFQPWREKIEREIDPGIRRARETLSAIAYLVEKKESSFSDFSEKWEQGEKRRSREILVERIRREQMEEEKERRQKEETQKEYERLKKEAETEFGPEIKDAEKRLKEAEAKAAEAEQEVSQQRGIKEKKKSPMKEALGW